MKTYIHQSEREKRFRINRLYDTQQYSLPKFSLTDYPLTQKNPQRRKMNFESTTDQNFTRKPVDTNSWEEQTQSQQEEQQQGVAKPLIKKKIQIPSEQEINETYKFRLPILTSKYENDNAQINFLGGWNHNVALIEVPSRPLSFARASLLLMLLNTAHCCRAKLAAWRLPTCFSLLPLSPNAGHD